MDFKVGEKVCLKVSPMKGSMRLGKRDMLSPRYISPFEVFKEVNCYTKCLEVSVHYITHPIKSYIYHMSGMFKLYPR